MLLWGIYQAIIRCYVTLDKWVLFYIFFLFLKIHFHWLCRSCGPCVALPTLPENGLSNRIRGLFENIVSKEAGSRCPLVWRMYMHFLVRLHTNLILSRMHGLVYICSSLFFQSYLTAAVLQALFKAYFVIMGMLALTNLAGCHPYIRWYQLALGI